MSVADDWAFTVLLPVWRGDRADHFEAAMASLAAATVRPHETLICQDGPLPPDLQAVVDGWASEPSVRIVSNPGPGGLQHNLNFAARSVQTPWLARADADDINLPHRFDAQIRFLNAHPEVSVLGGDIIEFWPDGAHRRKSMPREHAQIVRWARWRNPINHMTAFVRTDALHACGGYPDIPMKEDYALWLRMIGAGRRLANLDAELVRARLGEGFHRRRAGLNNLPSEWALYQLKRRVLQIGTSRHKQRTYPLLALR